MTHPPYEDWLFSSEPLTPQQTADLEAHLNDCESCRLISAAWRDVEAQLRSAPMAAPEPGFTSRWQARQEADTRRLQRKQSLAMLGFSMAGAATVLASLIILALPLLRSPAILFITVGYWLLQLATFADAARDLYSVLFQAASGSIPLLWWVLFAGIVSELGVLWVVSLRWLTNPRRVTNESEL